MVDTILLDVSSISDVAAVLSPGSIISLLTFFVPGLLFCLIFNYRTKNDYKNITFPIVIVSVVISYILNIILELIPISNHIFLIVSVNAISIVIGFIFSVIYKKMVEKKCISSTLSDEALNYVLLQFNENNIVFVEVYMKNKNVMVHGQLSAIDQSKTPNIVLENYKFCVFDDKMQISRVTDGNVGSYYFIKYDDIESIDFRCKSV